MKINLSISEWLNKKFNKQIPDSCIEAFEEESLNLLPKSIKNGYIEELNFPIPLPLIESEIMEIVSEYSEKASSCIESIQSRLDLGLEDPETVDVTLPYLFSSVSNSILKSTEFYPDFDYLSKEIIEELKKEDSQESWSKSMAKHGFFGNWDEVYDLLSPTGLMNAYTWMCDMDISASHDDNSSDGEYQFGDLFRANTPNWEVYIPVTIFSKYNSDDMIGKVLNDYELVNKIKKLSGISFSYNHKTFLNKETSSNSNSERLADEILEKIYKDEETFLYLKKWVVAGKKWMKLGITNNPERRDSEQNVLPVPAELIKLVKMPNRKIAEKIEKELLDLYLSQKISGANNKELFEMNDLEIDNLISTINSLEKKLNN